MGFVVHEITDWPTEDAAVRDYHVVIVRVKDIDAAPMLAARLRAKPHFGRRLADCAGAGGDRVAGSARGRGERVRRGPG